MARYLFIALALYRCDAFAPAEPTQEVAEKQEVAEPRIWSWSDVDWSKLTSASSPPSPSAPSPLATYRHQHSPTGYSPEGDDCRRHRHQRALQLEEARENSRALHRHVPHCHAPGANVPGQQDVPYVPATGKGRG